MFTMKFACPSFLKQCFAVSKCYRKYIDVGFCFDKHVEMFSKDSLSTVKSGCSVFYLTLDKHVQVNVVSGSRSYDGLLWCTQRNIFFLQVESQTGAFDYVFEHVWNIRNCCLLDKLNVPSKICISV